MINVKRILCPTDFSDCSQISIACASALAADFGAELVFVHVDELPAAYIEGLGSGFAGHGYVPEPAHARDEIRQQLSRVVPTSPKVPYRHVYLRGNPAEEILQLAEKGQANLIVMGTHGHSAVFQLLMGGVAERVVREAKCPVLTVKNSAPNPDSSDAE